MDQTGGVCLHAVIANELERRRIFNSNMANRALSSPKAELINL